MKNQQTKGIFINQKTDNQLYYMRNIGLTLLLSSLIIGIMIIPLLVGSFLSQPRHLFPFQLGFVYCFLGGINLYLGIQLLSRKGCTYIKSSGYSFLVVLLFPPLVIFSGGLDLPVQVQIFSFMMGFGMINAILLWTWAACPQDSHKSNSDEPKENWIWVYMCLKKNNATLFILLSWFGDFNINKKQFFFVIYQYC